MKPLRLFALSVALGGAVSAHAAEPNYNFVELGGAATESSAAGPSVKGDGYFAGFGAGYSYGFVAGEITDIELDSGDEVQLRSAQLGGHYPVASSDAMVIDVTAALSWESYTLEDGTSSDTDAGLGGRIGLRAAVAERFEADFFLGSAELDADLSLLHYGMAAQVGMSEHLAIRFSYRYAELEDAAGSTVETDQTVLSARILF